MEKLILIGAGGYAKSVLDSLDYYNYEVAGFLDEFSDKKEHLGYPVLANKLSDLDEPQKYVYFITIGDNKHRKNWYDRLVDLELRMINIVDSSAIISPRARIGNGCFVGKMAIINSESSIGNNCIINTKALVEHGCTVEDHVNLSTNSVINGDVRVGKGTFIGSCSVTAGQKLIGEWVIIGAGSVVIDNVEEGNVIAGVPAKLIRKEIISHE